LQIPGRYILSLVHRSLSFYVFVLCLVVEWGKTHFLRYMAGGFGSILRKYPVGIPLSEVV